MLDLREKIQQRGQSSHGSRTDMLRPRQDPRILPIIPQVETPRRMKENKQK